MHGARHVGTPATARQACVEAQVVEASHAVPAALQVSIQRPVMPQRFSPGAQICGGGGQKAAPPSSWQVCPMAQVADVAQAPPVVLQRSTLTPSALHRVAPALQMGAATQLAAPDTETQLWPAGQAR